MTNRPGLGGGTAFNPQQYRRTATIFRPAVATEVGATITTVASQCDPNVPVAEVTPGASATGNTNVITLVCRAVNLTSVDPSAMSEIAYAVEKELQASPGI